MKTSNATSLIAASALLLCRSAAHAHEGHGMGEAHWHAAEAWGFVLVVVIAAWFIVGQPGRKK